MNATSEAQARTPGTRTAVAIRHLAFEDLGCFAAPLAAAGYEVRYLDVGIDPFDAVDPAATDLLLILGGPIGAYEEDAYPFLSEEIRLIGRRLQTGRPTMGICLGAQLIARALGAEVRPGPSAEIGLAPLTLTDEGRRSPLASFGDDPVLHWHGDVFDLPADAVRLASTEACPNQAFAIGRNVLATQFHPEAGGPGFERWLIGHAAELAMRGLNPARLRAEHAGEASALVERATLFIEAWLAQLTDQ